MKKINAEEIAHAIREFVQARDWEQYHSPKNIAMALSAETGELLEHFQWLTQKESFSLSPEKKIEIGEELADILVYLIRLADLMKLDLSDAVTRKMEINAEKYPADKVRGSAKKYTEYE